MNRVLPTIIVFFAGLATTGCAQTVGDVVPVPVDPVLKTADNIDFHLHLPKRIVEWKRGENTNWVESSIETNQYHISAGHLTARRSKCHYVQTGEFEELSYDYR